MEPTDEGPPSRAASLPNDVLIVEDDLIIALDLEETLREIGVAASRTAASVAEALGFIAARAPQFALLDVGLKGETSLPIADRLEALGVPFAFLTGYGARDLPLPRFGDRPRIEKPFSSAALTIVLRNWQRRRAN